jgi:hypothetical protein
MLVLAVLLSLAACHSSESPTEMTTGATTTAATAASASSTTSQNAAPAPADLGALIKQMANPYPDGDPRYVSSNPYDYTKDNPAFDAIVAAGYHALAALEADLTAGGLGNYLDCIAIETITRCDLKQFPQFTWADAQSFKARWNSYLKQMPSLVDGAFMLSSYSPPKPVGLEGLGAPAVPFVIDTAARMGVANEGEVVATLQSLLTGSMPAATIAEFAQVNRVAIEKLRAYVEGR